MRAILILLISFLAYGEVHQCQSKLYEQKIDEALKSAHEKFFKQIEDPELATRLRERLINFYGADELKVQDARCNVELKFSAKQVKDLFNQLFDQKSSVISMEASAQRKGGKKSVSQILHQTNLPLMLTLLYGTGQIYFDTSSIVIAARQFMKVQARAAKISARGHLLTTRHLAALHLKQLKMSAKNLSSLIKFSRFAQAITGALDVLLVLNTPHLSRPYFGQCDAMGMHLERQIHHYVIDYSPVKARKLCSLIPQKNQKSFPSNCAIGQFLNDLLKKENFENFLFETFKNSFEHHLVQDRLGDNCGESSKNRSLMPQDNTRLQVIHPR